MHDIAQGLKPLGIYCFRKIIKNWVAQERMTQTVNIKKVFKSPFKTTLCQ